MLLFVNTPAVFASFKTGDFEYSADIKGQLKENTLYQVPLSAEILSRCSPGCIDLRLLGPDNSEIPYVIVEDMSRIKAETYGFSIVNYESGNRSAVITVKLPDRFKPISTITLNTAARDFNKNIVLHGSNDMKNWSFLAEDNIYDFSSQVNLRKTEIKFRPSNYKYYQISMTEKQTEGQTKDNISLLYKDLQFSVNNVRRNQIRIDDILGKTSLEESGVDVYDEIEFSRFSEYKENDGETMITLATGLPFRRIIFNISNHYYYRDVEVYGSDSGENDSYRFLMKDSIYRFPIAGDKEAKDYINCQSYKYKFYRLVIKNKDNPHLQLKSIKLEWLRKNLFFIALHEVQPYTLVVGGSSLTAPEYELSKFINQSNWHTHPFERLQVAYVRINQDYKPALTKDNKKNIEKNILTGIVVFIVIFVSYWLYALLKRTSIPRNRREE